jgi:hypothetical protein
LLIIWLSLEAVVVETASILALPVAVAVLVVIARLRELLVAALRQKQT